LKKEVWNSGSLICEKHYAGSFVFNNEVIDNTRFIFTQQAEGLDVLQVC